jgi:hypothetical protein
MLILAGKQPKVSSWKNHFKHIFQNYYTFPTYFKIIHALIITIVPSRHNSNFKSHWISKEVLLHNANFGGKATRG